MTNAEFTAKNNPAYSIPLRSFCMPYEFFTHKDQRRVQVLVVLPDEDLVVLVRLHLPLVTKLPHGQPSSCLRWTENTTPGLDSMVPRSYNESIPSTRRESEEVLTSLLAFHPEAPRYRCPWPGVAGTGEEDSGV